MPVEEFFEADKREHQAYMRNKTLPVFREKLKTLPKDFYYEAFGKRFYFTHYAWESDRLIMDYPDVPNATAKTVELFKDTKADYIFVGHNHNPADFESNGRKFVCVGTLGMKYPSYYVVIDIDNKQVHIERKKIYYNVEKLKNDMLQENYPQAIGYSKWFKQNNKGF